MMNARQLANTLDEMMKETRRGRLNWSMQIESTDDRDASCKEHGTQDGNDWLVDECFVEYACPCRPDTHDLSDLSAAAWNALL